MAVQKQFEIAVTLVGLAILYDSECNEPSGVDRDGFADGASGADAPETTRDRVRRATRAIAPVLLPLINNLADLGQFELDESDLVGQAA
jgi:hypothetical protein